MFLHNRSIAGGFEEFTEVAEVSALPDLVFHMDVVTLSVLLLYSKYTEWFTSGLGMSVVLLVVFLLC